MKQFMRERIEQFCSDRYAGRNLAKHTAASLGDSLHREWCGSLSAQDGIGADFKSDPHDGELDDAVEASRVQINKQARAVCLSFAADVYSARAH